MPVKRKRTCKHPRQTRPRRIPHTLERSERLEGGMQHVGHKMSASEKKQQALQKILKNRKVGEGSTLKFWFSVVYDFEDMCRKPTKELKEEQNMVAGFVKNWGDDKEFWGYKNMKSNLDRLNRELKEAKEGKPRGPRYTKYTKNQVKKLLQSAKFVEVMNRITLGMDEKIEGMSKLDIRPVFNLTSIKEVVELPKPGIGVYDSNSKAWIFKLVCECKLEGKGKAPAWKILTMLNVAETNYRGEHSIAKELNPKEYRGRFESVNMGELM